MRFTRRGFMITSAAAAATAALGPWGKPRAAVDIRLSACDWSLRMSANPEGLDVAKELGLDGLEVSATDEARDEIKLADPAFRERYKEAMERTGLPVSSVGMAFLNQAPFARDPRGPAWLEQTIEAAADLEAEVILMAFFGDGDLRDEDGEPRETDVDTLVERLRDAAPMAEDAGVILGIENWLSADQNMAILERVESHAVQVYYDVRNSTVRGYDVPAEIRRLGGRIAPSIHFKDGDHALGEGRVDFHGVAEAMRDIQYSGWVTLETAILDDDRGASFRRNAAFVRDLFGLTD
ncbi:MAG: sugar phosphate isomerase/epimerase family protein [Candidatus Hydrogenedentota bacterium]